jgi:hypothetical protein
MAGSGDRVMVLNTRERLVSTDHNRLQQFKGADTASVLARLLLSSDDEDIGSGEEALVSSVTDPLTAAVLDGIRFMPLNGTVDALVSSGVVALADPDGAPSADDVPWKWVVDPGITATGTLVMTPGAGATRVDVVEFSRTVEDQEFDNRDVFDPSTGLFTPVNVVKVRRGRLAYRIRTGTPAAGFPGTASGWCPIAVCSVPAAAASWDVVQIWDVRPLARDRVNSPFASSARWARRRSGHLSTDISVPLNVKVSGKVDTSLGPWRAGGRVGVTALGAEPTGFFDVRSPANQEVGFTGFGANGPNGYYSVYFVFPFGLPRWMRYSDFTSGARVPVGTRGIMSVSMSLPNFNGRPVAAVTTPASTGLLDPGTNVYATLAWTARTAVGVPFGVVEDGDWTSQVNFNLPPVAPSTVSDPSYIEWTVTTTNDFPGNARAVHLYLSADFTVVAAADKAAGLITVSEVGDGRTPLAGAVLNASFTPLVTGVNQSTVISVMIPLTFATVAGNEFAGGNRTYLVRWQYLGAVGTTSANQGLLVLAWRLGP